MKIETKLTIKIGDQKITLNEQEAKELKNELNRIFNSYYSSSPNWIYSGTGSTGNITLGSLPCNTADASGLILSTSGTWDFGKIK